MMEKVNHPQHYNQGSIECIDAMLQCFGANAVIDFCRINAFKYLWRSDYKDNCCEDMQKAVWYLSKAIEILDNEINKIMERSGNDGKGIS